MVGWVKAPGSSAAANPCHLFTRRPPHWFSAYDTSTRIVGTATTGQSALSFLMPKEFTVIIERDNDWYIAYCPEVSGPTGQGQRHPLAWRGAVAGEMRSG